MQINDSRNKISTYQSTVSEIQKEQVEHNDLAQKRDALHPAMVAELGRIISFYEFQIGSLQESIVNSSSSK